MSAGECNAMVSCYKGTERLCVNDCVQADDRQSTNECW